jgi:hypothetical protein
MGEVFLRPGPDIGASLNYNTHGLRLTPLTHIHGSGIEAAARIGDFPM